MAAITITADQIQAIVAKLEAPALRPEGLGAILGTIFQDLEKAVGWVEGLAGDFCNAYKTGVSVDGQMVSIYDVLKHTSDIATATGTVDGKAIAAAITLVIGVLTGICGKPVDAP